VNATGAVLLGPKQLELTAIPLPEIGADDGLLEVEACGLCGTDYGQWTGEYNIAGGYPVIPGHEIFGRIARIGANARKRWGVDIGARVAVEGSIPCNACEWCIRGEQKHCIEKQYYGLTIKSDGGPRLWGGYATHVYLHPRTLLHKLPEHVPTGTMALYNPLTNAVHWTLVAGRVGAGDSVLICGPGQRGLLAVFAARVAGARRIIVSGTGADRTRLAKAKELGATTTVNVDEEDLIGRVREVTGGRGVDVVVDVSSHAVAPIAQGIEVLRIGGRLVVAGLKGNRPLVDVYSDTIAMKELEIVGVLSAGWPSLERAIALLGDRHEELASLVTHSYALNDVTTAVRVLGREIIDGPELFNVHVRGEV
jgi:alcohol dehydrogenase